MAEPPNTPNEGFTAEEPSPGRHSPKQPSKTEPTREQSTSAQPNPVEPESRDNGEGSSRSRSKSPDPDPNTYFWYKDAQRRNVKVGGGSKEPPRFVTEHIIKRARWPARKLRRPPPLAPSPPPPPPGPVLRRSKRIAAQEARRAAEEARLADEAPALARPDPPALPAPAPISDELAIAAVLGHGLDDEDAEDACQVCGKGPAACAGKDCYESFRRACADEVAERVEIRETGDSMGLGLYVRPDRALPARFCLGEYLGELVPTAGRGGALADLAYAFCCDGDLHIDARRAGNHTRFVNHHCRPNAEARRAVVGGRRMIRFRARRAIGPGEQVFISYGRGYFQDMDCLCDAKPGPHKPPR